MASMISQASRIEPTSYLGFVVDIMHVGENMNAAGLATRRGSGLTLNQTQQRRWCDRNSGCSGDDVYFRVTWWTCLEGSGRDGGS